MTNEEWEQIKEWLLKLAYKYDLAAAEARNEETQNYNKERADRIKVFIMTKS